MVVAQGMSAFEYWSHLFLRYYGRFFSVRKVTFFVLGCCLPVVVMTWYSRNPNAAAITIGGGESRRRRKRQDSTDEDAGGEGDQGEERQGWWWPPSVQVVNASDIVDKLPSSWAKKKAPSSISSKDRSRSSSATGEDLSDLVSETSGAARINSILSGSSKKKKKLPATKKKRKNPRRKNAKKAASKSSGKQKLKTLSKKKARKKPKRRRKLKKEPSEQEPSEEEIEGSVDSEEYSQ